MLPHSLQPHYPLIFFLFIKNLKKNSDWVLTFMLDRSSLLTWELNFMQYPDGPPINVKWVD